MKLNNTEQNLNPREVLSEASKLYQYNFQLLILMSAILGAINLCQIIYNNFATPSQSILIKLGGTALMFISLYFSSRLSITLYQSISNCYRDISTSIVDNYRESAKVFWPYIRAMIMYVITLALPTIVIIFSIKYFNPFTLISCILGFAWLTYWGVRNFLGPIIRILSPEEKDVFAKSRAIASKYFKPMLVLILVFALPVIVYNLYGFVEAYLYKPTSTTLLVKQIVNQLIHVFYLPFATSIVVIMYHKVVKPNTY